MNTSIAVLAALVLALAAGTATAERVQVVSCLTDRPTSPEPLGDRPGHTVQVVAATCVDTAGQQPPAVSRIHAVWEQDLAAARLLSADGVVRQPGVLATFHLTEGVQHPVMKDGRPIGWTATGRGVYTLATGVAAALANRTFSWLASSTGPNSYSLETRLDD